MGYKMKGFSGFGNSPLKQKGDNLKRIMTENNLSFEDFLEKKNKRTQN